VASKRGVGDLAILGGPPVFSEPLHVGLPNFGDPVAFFRRMETILATRRFTNGGPFVHELEAGIAKLTGARHCIATCNATSALQILARALDLQGEVAMPSFTFVATAHAFSWLGLEPIFCDIEAAGHGADAYSLERVIGPRCSAIVAVHTWGIPCNVDAIERLARERGLALIYDAAQALACSYHGQGLGSLGDAAVFSFHATKFVNSFEGGAITTQSDELAEKVRRMRNFGFDGYDSVRSLGTNAKLSELHAAAGLTTLDALPAIVEENRRCFETYRGLLEPIPGVRLLDIAGRGRSNYQYVVVEIERGNVPAIRDDLVQALHAEGVFARRYFHPGCHRLMPYAARAHVPSLTVAESVSDRTVVLPTGPSVGNAAIASVVELIRLVLENQAEVRAALATFTADSRM
jgi:dTDP-4-amino-4,6-dideoxygalactose transaminase